MSRELIRHLLATPTLQVANVGAGDQTRFSVTSQEVIDKLQSVSQRRTWARSGFSLADGSFPAPTPSWLRESIAAFDLAKNKPQTRRFLTRRAYALGRSDLLPHTWRDAAKEEALLADASTSDDHDGMMIAVYPPSELATVLAGTEEGDHTPDDLHVTVLYFGQMDEIDPDLIPLVRDRLAEAAAVANHFTAKVTDVSQFVSEDGENPQIYEIECEGLAEFRDVLIQASEEVGLSPMLNFDFHPHMTVRYGGNMLAAVPEGGDAEWPVTSIVLATGTNYEAFPLGETADADDTEGATMATKSTVVGGGPGSGPQPHTAESAKAAGDGNDKPAGSTGIADPKAPPTASPSTTTPATEPHGPGESGAGGNTPKKKPKKTPAAPAKAAPAPPGAPTPKAPGTNAGWSESFAYYWDRSTNEVFRVSPETDVVDVWDTDTENHVWTPSEFTADEAKLLPSITTADTLSVLVAAAEGGDGDSGNSDAPDVPMEAGRQFKIAVVVPEGIPSGDNRSFSKDSVEAKEPPIPLLWQKQTSEGHDGSVTVGKITSVERIEAGLGNAYGVFDTHEDAVEAARQVKEKFLTGVSADVDQFEAEITEMADGGEALNITHGRLVAATLVAKPAFQECSIEFVNEEGEDEVILASAGPLHPPAEWFANPKFTKPTHLDVSEDGRVFGHIAEWGTPHLGNSSLRPPKNVTNYSEFNSRPVRTMNGTDIKTGQLTLAGGHAALDLPVDRVVAHYDDTNSAVADVVAGEDEFGIWVAGAMRPNVTDHQVRAFRASDPSGDWRMVRGNLELVAVCQVNTPGFPVARSLVASAGVVTALVAAGTSHLVTGEKRGEVAAVLAAAVKRIEALESAEEGRRKEAAIAKIMGLSK